MHTLEQLQAGELHGIKELHLSAGLSQFPEAIFALADSLEVLNLSGNDLNALPADFGRLYKLKAVFFFNNQFTAIPSVLADCPALDIYGFRYNQIEQLDPNTLGEKLRWLILTGNCIDHIKAGMGRLKHLQKCMLAGNALTELPEDLQQCHQLELLRISSNKLQALPQWLMKMPRLSWLAYAGNPFCVSLTLNTPVLTQIDWAELEVQHTLGQGASGVIYHAMWQQKPVALKLFKAAMTSDGSPDDELRATVLAGNHPNLIGLHGQLVNHPEGKHGLIMPLIHTEFENLAGPPSLESCTRDIYAPNRVFSWLEIVNISLGVAQAAQHIHQQGVLHGDLYPHNTLVNTRGECVLTDFGAACLYDPANKGLSQLEALEVRAFGCILDGLLTRYKGGASDCQQAVKHLMNLQARCFDQDVSARPLFDDIVEQLLLIKKIE